MDTARVFLSSGQVLQAAKGAKLAEVVAAAGIALDSPCGGQGKCGQCTIAVKFSEAGETQHVLACTYLIDTDLWVQIPVNVAKKGTVILSSGSGLPVNLNSGINKYCIAEGIIGSPSYWEGIGAKAAQLGLRVNLTLDLLQRIARLGLAKKEAPFTLVSSGNEVIDVELGDTKGKCYGLAVDIGTTTVVGYLMDLITGEQIAVSSGLNGQRVFGADVITRINTAKAKENQLKQLQERVIDTINQILGTLIQETGVAQENIAAVTLAGNTCMQQLVLGLNPSGLGQAPFSPVISQSVEVSAGSLNLAVNPQARVWLLPVIAGFVGGDTVAAILASDLHRLDGVRMLVDIGTNGELVINAHGRMMARSAAAGPALEGAEITFGMRAELGAISKVQLLPEIKLDVIGGGPVQGICGSGLVDLVAELIHWKLINQRGRLSSAENYHGPEALRQRLVKGEKGVRFIVRQAQENQGQEIYLDQQDVTQIQLAKGALRTAMELLRMKSGQEGSQVDEVLLAGAFGNFLNIEQALLIGLLPTWAKGKVRMIGNAAGEGAKMALLSVEKRVEAAEIARSVEFLELAGTREFQENFVKALLFDWAQ